MTTAAEQDRPPAAALVPRQCGPVDARPRAGRQAAAPAAVAVAAPRSRVAGWPLAREVALLAVMLCAYTAARMLAGKDVDLAFANASRVLDLEGWLRLPSEQHLQEVVLASRPLARAACAYYAAAHLPVTALTLVWLFLRRPAHYLWARRALAVSTLTALALYLLVPTAPPRLLPGLGFVDVPTLLGQSVYGPSTHRSLTDQYAAMPSLHVGWAVLVAVVAIAAGTRRSRWLWLLHPLLTVLVVVSTGNHYWLDGLAGTALVAAALVLTRRFPLPVRRAAPGSA